MVKLSELRSADEVHEHAMRDLEYRREYERTRLANEVAIKVIGFRVDNGLSQTAFARMLGWRQPNVARLEAGDHEPSIATLSRLAEVTNLDFSVEVKRGRMQLRHPARSTVNQPGAERRRTATRRGRSAEIREWAARQGLTVSGGRIPAALIRDYEAAEAGQVRKRA